MKNLLLTLFTFIFWIPLHGAGPVALGDWAKVTVPESYQLNEPFTVKVELLKLDAPTKLVLSANWTNENGHFGGFLQYLGTGKAITEPGSYEFKIRITKTKPGLKGLMLSVFGGDYFSYSYLARPIVIVGDTFALNRVASFLAAVVICGALYLWLNHSRAGLSIRAIAVAPASARLVGINVTHLAALAFGLGGAVTAVGGALLSTYLTLDASTGIIFTLKALIIVIMGGVGDVRGTIVAALLLGIVETLVATLLDPGLTLAAAYTLFILILLFRPQGLFGKKPA